ncbi:MULTISPECIES: lipid-A-disaccharide synthase [unclassified Ruegeria]|uniref:lipid-A-disaccharide synthase n=1 Tax=unclassified Ruegeria TaxID=2625375 RepID=UPI0014928561|nr:MULTISPECIES: lipid-A-disaccharide synthase [unclassified Ruegeria]NOD87454.1 lipid-A-disaccharide synthase [Ruegeria sp. HKCCD4318]NOE13009.1 lipid-A-disaccharide synthase [Ruegeria sp. HKCCD4318-2]NOG08824.1 lipid-A-disaccharide synthase [Ruegeria sp. HKCCD4315]
MRVFLVAGEPSGDRLGGALMEGLKTLVPNVEFDGVGGPLMEAQGLTSQFPMSELSVMGLVEVLPKFFHLKRRISETAQAVLDTNPDVLITIDSPDFSLRVAKIVKAASNTRTVHYVAPSVWAWRPGRADKMAKVIDHVLALLPFEPPYMERAGMECDFVGHPVASEPVATRDEIAAFRSRFDLGDAPILLALPGSRRGEIERLAESFAGALRLFAKDHPGYRVVIPTVGATTDLVKDLVTDWPGDPVVLDPRHEGTDQALANKRSAFGAASLALAASGTVSLELAAQNTPMVIAYKLNWLTQKMAERMVKLDTVTLVNLVSDTRAVPECLLDDCRPEKIAHALHNVINAPDAQQLAMSLTMDRLGRGGEAPGLRAARAVLERMQVHNA